MDYTMGIQDVFPTWI